MGIRTRGKGAVVALKELARHPVVNDSFAGLPLVVIFESRSATISAFERRVGDTEPTFRMEADTLIDDQTRSVWDPVTGRLCHRWKARGYSADPRCRHRLEPEGVAHVPPRWRGPHRPCTLKPRAGIQTRVFSAIGCGAERIELHRIACPFARPLASFGRSPSFVNFGKTETRNSVRYTRQGMRAVSQGRPDHTLGN